MATRVPSSSQAAIQAVHCDAARFEDTDWPQIVTLYDNLYEVMPTAVVAMNRAIALAETAGPQVALVQLDTLSRDLAGYHLLHASRATMLRRLGREKEAIHAFDLAIELAPGPRERGFLDRQREAGHRR